MRNTKGPSTIELKFRNKGATAPEKAIICMQAGTIFLILYKAILKFNQRLSDRIDYVCREIFIGIPPMILV